MGWEAFLEQVLERLNTLRSQDVMADVTIFLGRKDKETGRALPPRLHVRIHGQEITYTL